MIDDRTKRKNEEYALFVLYKQTGNIKAKHEIIKRNLPYVWKVALKYVKNKKIETKELVNEGVIGLIRAIDLFDHNRGLHFLTYAGGWIKSYIINYIKEKTSLIHLPHNKYEEIRKEKKKLQNGQKTSSEILELINIVKDGVPFDKQISFKNNLTYCDIIKDDNIPEPDKNLEQKRLNGMFHHLISLLNDDMEKNILNLLYGENKQKKYTIKDISKMYDISPMRVKQYKNQAVRKIKSFSDMNELKEKYEMIKDL